jgi:hypothetical protein
MKNVKIVSITDNNQTYLRQISVCGMKFKQENKMVYLGGGVIFFGETNTFSIF